MMMGGRMFLIFSGAQVIRGSGAARISGNEIETAQMDGR